MARRFLEWMDVGRLAYRQVSLLQLVRFFFSRKVGRRVWVARLRTCLRCPVYDPVYRRCWRPTPDGPLGCNCWVPALAKMPAPYSGGGRSGCWGWVRSEGELGWGDQRE